MGSEELTSPFSESRKQDSWSKPLLPSSFQVSYTANVVDETVAWYFDAETHSSEYLLSCLYIKSYSMLSSCVLIQEQVEAFSMLVRAFSRGAGLHDDRSTRTAPRSETGETCHSTGRNDYS